MSETDKEIETFAPERLRIDPGSKSVTSLNIDPERIPNNSQNERLLNILSSEGKATWDEKEHTLEIIRQPDGTLRGLLISQRKGSPHDGRQSVIMGGPNRIFAITEEQLEELKKTFEEPDKKNNS